ncbi:MAG: hypothetical protein MJZ86_01005 [Bacteroidales bacterium]|nr:hypothetical protein [Bacteroidales bacterium]
MKNLTPQKQAYQEPVVRSVEFKVEQGFAGSGNIIHNHPFSMENVTEGTSYDGSYFNHQLMGGGQQ